MLEKTFDPKTAEPRLYAAWEASGAFAPKDDPNAEPFSIVIPPPNVTGRLHIGHALNNTLQDVLARFERDYFAALSDEELVAGLRSATAAGSSSMPETTRPLAICIRSRSGWPRSCHCR